MDSRRTFLKAATAFSATGLVGSCLAPQLKGAAPRQPGPHKRLIGVQMAPFNLLHEGIENTLDLLQDKAAVNTIICYT